MTLQTPSKALSRTMSTLYLADTMLALPRSVKRLIALCVDICLCVLTVWLALCLRYETWVTIQGNQWLAVVAAPLIAIPLFVVFGLYRAIFRFAGREALEAVARAIGIYALIYSVIFTAVGFQDIPRTIGLLQPALLLLTVGAVRLIARHLLGEPYVAQLRSTTAANVLIYGAGDSGLALASSLSKSEGMRVVGFLDDNPSLHRGQLMGIDVYNPQDLIKTVERLRVRDVLLALPSITRTRRNEILKMMSTARVAVRTLPTLSDLAIGRVQASDLRELDIEDLLGRDAVAPDSVLLSKNIQGKVVLVTGAGGSIGSELCRQIMRIEPATLILLELNEFALYTIHEELLALSSKTSTDTKLVPLLASVQDKPRLLEIITAWQPHTIYHTAAYKHVPLVEANPVAGIQNNVFGTLNVALAALDCGVENLVLISTDKAVRPTNVMGATKRLAEMVLQALAQEAVQQGKRTKLCMVRFGNVLGSSGSVVPKFRAQIQHAGPVSVTHPEVTRYFMTISEAAQLVIQATAMPSTNPESAEVFVLDMGQPVKIIDLARSMIELSGFTVKDERQPDGDIAIEITGLRPGEKLYEELLIGEHPQKTTHPKIMRAEEMFTPWSVLAAQLNTLMAFTSANNFSEVTTALQGIVEQYTPVLHPIFSATKSEV
jgi:FlaA1/EpsC-like NDP-sugar epimerase